MIVESQADLGQQIQVQSVRRDTGQRHGTHGTHGTHGKVVERSNKLMIFYGNQWEFVLLRKLLSMGYLSIYLSISRTKIGDILWDIDGNSWDIKGQLMDISYHIMGISMEYIYIPHHLWINRIIFGGLFERMVPKNLMVYHGSSSFSPVELLFGGTVSSLF